MYETDFRDVSHGFRPGRGAHGALDSLWKQAMKLGGGWIVDVADKQGFLGNLNIVLDRKEADPGSAATAEAVEKRERDISEREELIEYRERDVAAYVGELQGRLNDRVA